jgi:rhodanese-related sulfurtransferase
MGNTSSSIQKISYEDIQNSMVDKSVVLINTIDSNNQDCLISYTIPSNKETEVINTMIKKREFDKKIYIYGIHYYDENVLKQYNQLKKIGFRNVYIYFGGIFEWLCLQEIYGLELFPTTRSELDILKYKPQAK